MTPTLSVLRDEITAIIGAPPELVWVGCSDARTLSRDVESGALNVDEAGYPECLEVIVPDHDPGLSSAIHNAAVKAGFERICMNMLKEADIQLVVATRDPFTASFQKCFATVRTG